MPKKRKNLHLEDGDSAVVIRGDGEIEIAVANGEEGIDEHRLADTCPSLHLALMLASATSNEDLMDELNENFEEVMGRVGENFKDFQEFLEWKEQRDENYEKMEDIIIPKEDVNWDDELRNLNNGKDK